MIHESVDKAKTQSACGMANKNAQERQKQDQIRQTLSKIDHKLIVMSGKGGVGKSSIAANLAVTLSQMDLKVGLMDVDLHGPSIAKIMGLKGLPDITQDKRLIPVAAGENLKVMSMQSLMQEEDQAVIWRGPAKTGMIHQFVGTVDWGALDFLVIDAPPGTGDEPLTVVQTIPEAWAVIITTPQHLALADVRKSINFCKTVQLDILGIIENMGPFACPSCNHQISLFKSGGGLETAQAMDIPFLGTLPFDPHVVNACDDGQPIAREATQSAFSLALKEIVEKITHKLK